MIDSRLGFVSRALRWWVRLYTSGLSSGERGDRRDEIESDHHEHTHSSGTQSGDTAWQVLGRMVRGLPADVAWRLSRPGAERRAGHGGAAAVGRGGGAMALVAYRRLGPRWNALASSELYDPSTDRWTRTGDMGERRASPTATLLEDERVLVAGGLDAATRSLASAEVYDPGMGTWTAVGDMIHRRAFHTAALLADGTVLVAGGNVDEERGISYAEVFDPRSGAWSAVEEMDAVRLSHSMVSIPGGRVIVLGGSDTPDGSGHSTSEVYDPVTGRWSRY